MFRFLTSILFLSFSTGAFAAGTLQPQLSFQDRVRILQGATVYNAACCKTCRKGKACGNSCISKSKSCHKGTGCACNG